jgi:hypothetical protein
MSVWLQGSCQHVWHSANTPVACTHTRSAHIDHPACPLSANTLLQQSQEQHIQPLEPQQTHAQPEPQTSSTVNMLLPTATLPACQLLHNWLRAEARAPDISYT